MFIRLYLDSHVMVYQLHRCWYTFEVIQACINSVHLISWFMQQKPSVYSIEHLLAIDVYRSYSGLDFGNADVIYIKIDTQS